MAENFKSFVDVLAHRVRVKGSAIAYTYLRDGEEDEQNISYELLWAEVKGIAGHLQRLGNKGDRVLLLYSSDLNFIRAFLACMVAGLVPVPAYPPRTNRSFDRLMSIIGDCGSKLILTTREISDDSRFKKHFSNNHVVTTDALSSSTGFTPVTLEPDDTAILQYTSGSTGDPKGVIVTHANLLDNQALIAEAFGQDDSSIIVGWLPHFHDMGLIGNILQPIYVGARSILMSPTHFLQKPVRWLNAITRYGANTSGGPNFAYDLCVKKISERERLDLDLSSWKVAFNGAEMVNRKTLDDFSGAFKECGFKTEAFYACYGMAEATLYISHEKMGQEPISGNFNYDNLQYTRDELIVEREKQSIELVSNGRSTGLDVVVVGTNGMRAPEGKIGEIWIKGRSVAKGYWNKPQETADKFGARLEHGDGPYFKTGDLGVFQDGKLFVAGRLKDLIILNGRNYFPEDIENLMLAELPDRERLGKLAAFAVKDIASEKLVLVVEIDFDKSISYSEVIQRINTLLAQHLEISAHEVVLIRKGTMLRTTSGKVQRNECRKAYLSNQLERIAAHYTVSPTTHDDASTDEMRVIGLVERVQGTRISPTENIFSFGLDSIKAIELSALISSEFNISFTSNYLWEYQTVREIAGVITNGGPAKVHQQAGDLTLTDVSAIQKNIAFDQLINSTGNAYNIPINVYIGTDLEHSRLENALNELVRTFEILRTNFYAVEDVIHLKIKPSLFVAVHRGAVVDGTEALHERLRQIANKPFDLLADVLFRAEVCQDRNGGWHLLFVIHHIVADGYSLGILMKTLLKYYHGETGCIADLLTRSASYRMYANAQAKTILQDQAFAEAKDYWRRQLEGAQLLDLPRASGINPDDKTGESESLTLDARTTESIKALAQLNGTTSYNILLACFYFLLQRLTGQRDLVVASPSVIGRTGIFLDTIGPMLNMVMNRCAVQLDDSFATLLERVKNITTESAKHSHYPFFNILQDLDLQTDHTGFPISSVSFNYLNFGQGYEQNLLQVFPGNAGLDVNFELNCYATVFDDRCTLRLDYRKAFYKPDTIRVMLSKFEAIIRFALRAPHEKLVAIPLLHQSIAAPVIKDAPWYKIDSTILDVFGAQATRLASHVAIVSDGERITYGDLDGTTNQIARALKNFSAVPQRPIAFCLTRGADIAQVVLATLKCRCPYVPLDPQYAIERLRFIVDEIHPQLILCDADSFERLSPLATAGYVLVAIDSFDFTAESREPLHVIDAHPDDVAYIMFTSGSTGKPKGVAQTHRNLLYYISNYASCLSITSKDVMSGFSSPYFDSFNNDFYGAILSGATYCRFSLQENINAHEVYTWVNETGLTVWHSVPVLFQFFASTWIAEKFTLPTVRIVKLVGEAVRKDHFENFKLLTSPHANLVVSLGSTECTLSTINCFPHNYQPSSTIMPVGFPANRTTVVISDEDLNALDVLEPGEIVVESNFLPTGYWNQPELAAQTFPQKNGKRIYRTGDIGRRLLDGRIEWISRRDGMVKIRGVRVELTDVEYHLLHFPGVDKAVAMTVNRSGENAELFAYIVGRSPIDASTLKAHLASQLPSYAVPDFVIQVPSFPLTASGKVDRKKLAAENVSVKQTDHTDAAGNIEAEVLQIWRDVLQTDAIGVKESFFQLGGNSIKAMRAMSQIGKRFGVSLPIKTIFKHPTVRELSLVIGTAEKKTSRELVPVPVGESYPLSYSQKRIWILEKISGGTNEFILTGKYRFESEVDLPAFSAAVQALVARHESLRTTFKTISGTPRQVVHGYNSDYCRIEQAEQFSPLSTDLLLQHENESLNQSFDLSVLPLFRLKIIRFSDAQVLLFSIHHIICDGWSREILIHELLDIYEKHESERSYSPDALLVQYKDFAVWQNDLIAGDRGEGLKKFWHGIFQRRVSLLELPYDFERKGGGMSASCFTKLEPEVVASAKQFALDRNISFFALFLAAFNVLLQKLTGQTDIVVAAPVANREHASLRNVVGFFLNTIFLRNEVSGTDSIESFLARVNQSLLDGLSNQSYPVEKLLEEMNIQRDFSRFPLTPVLINYLNFDAQPANVNLIDHSDQLKRNVTFDLELVIKEEGSDILIKAIYRDNVFARDAVQYYLESFVYLLRQFLSSADRHISKMKLAPMSVQTASLEDVIAATPGFVRFEKNDAQETIVSRFEEIVNRYPDRIAVKIGTDSISYRELNKRANLLAGGMSGLSRQRVALYFDHGAEMIIAMVAALKAGNAYVPLNMDYPSERLSFIVDDSGANVIITNQPESAITGIIPADKKIKVLYYTRQLDVPAPVYEPVNILPDDVAYILYTSGSSGMPKGVLQNHRNVLHFMRVYTNNLKIEINDRLSLIPTYSFDASVMDIFGGLLNGAMLLPYNIKAGESIRGLSRYLADEAVTIFHTVPTIYRIFLQDSKIDSRMVSAVRLVVLGGEPVFKSDFTLFQKFFHPDAIFINGLGPTESTVTLQNILRQRDVVNRHNVPVGIPVADTTVYLLDEHHQEVGPFEIGEVVYHSDYLSIGYLNNPTLTSSAFQSNPVTGVGRTYRSGDLGRRLFDGSIEFIGRATDQVKIRGNRVEPGEVTECLKRLPGIKTAVVMPAEIDGAMTLLAYYVSETEIETAELRNMLLKQLPEYMVPTRFIKLDVLPVTPNGKLDRSRLLELAVAQPIIKTNIVHPRTDMEQTIAALWRDVLMKKDIGIFDNFFEYGGNSLKFIQLFNKLDDAFPGVITTSLLFDRTTIAEQARLMNERLSTKAPEAFVVIDL